MPNINIAISNELLIGINVEAAKLGMSQKEWVIMRLEEFVGRAVMAQKAVDEIVDQAGQKKSPPPTQTAVGLGDEDNPACKICGVRMLDFGNMWYCSNHGKFPK
jgi:hypothetical protein